MWVVFNEGWGQYDTARLTRMVKKLDPTRLVNNASGWTDMPAGDVIDMHTYPGPAAPPKPSRSGPACWASSAAWALGVDGHTWAKKTWGYRGTASREELTQPLRRPAAQASGSCSDSAGLSRRRLHADHRRRDRVQRPDDLRPRSIED